MSSYTLPELCKDFKCETCTLVHTFSGINGMFRKIAFAPSITSFTMEMLIDQCRPGIDAAFEEIIRKRIKSKVNFGIQVLFQKIDISDGTVACEDRGYMSVDAMVVQTRSDIDDAIETAIQDLDDKIDNYISRGSNWVVGAIERLILSVVACK